MGFRELSDAIEQRRQARKEQEVEREQQRKSKRMEALEKWKQEKKRRQAEASELHEKQSREHMIDMEGRLYQLKSEEQEIVRQLRRRPPVIIQESISFRDKQKCLALMDAMKTLKGEATRYNRILLKFGSPVMTLIAMAITVSVGIYWVICSLGFDAIGGSPALTVGFSIIVMVMIDTVGYFCFFGFLACLEIFMPRRFYIKLIECIFFAGFAVGMFSFLGSAILRFKEVL